MLDLVPSFPAAQQWDVPGRDVRRTGSAKTTQWGLEMDQIIQIIGALLILSGFAGSQFGYLDQRSWTYLIVNALGSAILAFLGWHERQWGSFCSSCVGPRFALEHVRQMAGPRAAHCPLSRTYGGTLVPESRLNCIAMQHNLDRATGIDVRYGHGWGGGNRTSSGN